MPDFLALLSERNRSDTLLFTSLFLALFVCAGFASYGIYEQGRENIRNTIVANEEQ